MSGDLVWNAGAYPFIFDNAAPIEQLQSSRSDVCYLSGQPKSLIVVEVEIEVGATQHDVVEPWVRIRKFGASDIHYVEFTDGFNTAWTIMGHQVTALLVGSNAPYTLRVFETDTGLNGPNSMVAVGDRYLEFRAPCTSSFVVEVEYEGDDNITVYALENEHKVVDKLLDFDGPGTRRSVYFGDREVSALLVHASGPWSLRVNGNLRDP